MICNADDAPEYYLQGCGTAWNTFEHAAAAGLRHAWRWTACLVCGMWAATRLVRAEEDDD